MKNSGNIFLIPTLLVVFSVLSLMSKSASDDGSAAKNKAWPDKHELRRQLWRQRKMLLVYGTQKPELRERYRQVADTIAKRYRWLDVIVKADVELSARETAATPLYLIGSPSSNKLMPTLLSALPVKFSDGRFRIDGLFESSAKDVFVLANFPNPQNLSMPVSAVTGYDDEAILRFLSGSNPYNSRAGDFRVFHDGLGSLLGFFTQEKTGAPWEVDRKRTRNYLREAQHVVETPHYVFHYRGAKPAGLNLHALAAAQEKQLRNFFERLHLTLPQKFQKIQYFLYESAEDKGLLTGNTDLSHANLSAWQVHALLNDSMSGVDFTADAALLSERYIGRTSSQALRDGLSVAFSREWGRRGFRYWVKLFSAGGHLNALSDLLNNAVYEKESYLFMKPQAGSFVAFLLQKYGPEPFIRFYKTWPAHGLPEELSAQTDASQLQQEWHQAIQNYAVAVGSPSRREKDRAWSQFHKGFCFAHEGYQIYNGYLSQKAAESLKKLHELGTNWISLSPFGYLREHNKPGYLSYSFGAGSENDESLIVAAAAAKALGMGVMLKPHVLTNGHNWGWPGEIKMQTEADWQAFFTYYLSWIRHYALLAEMYDMDMLCLGVEFMHATTPEHAQQWRQIVRKIRAIYHGPLVYAANWWQEFEQITFWDDLDFIGLNCYYPLSKKDSVTLGDLKAGFERFLPEVERVVAKYQKPLLLTEIGFTSTAQNWKEPHVRRRGEKPDLADQALAYRAAFEELWPQKWLAGIYWWKWPTYLEDGGPRHTGFTPNAKPAEKVVKEYFTRPARRGSAR